MGAAEDLMQRLAVYQKNNGENRRNTKRVSRF